ncbi:putative cis-aconitic acid decarboxylase protein [Neofusicoccum parvum UCRNP2]|uniref:Putative cis-aconitic acid decarboxylase protein n=1 Tax=Botryosphaeria parva (strain UCR-NP2) TaxID=1287680 RepID=R1GAN6_BOTPV|nr:putative cis-aconitic acid decarboxylase protein [Neofusicoccum parvum UCRNP2]
MKHQLESEIDGDGTTEQLARWIVELRAESMPARVLERAKHLILDGIGCGLVGARVPWSAKMLDAVSAYEPDGPCSVIGSEKRFGPLAAAILNGSFIQATELDDYHSMAPLHSASIVLPALLAGVEATKAGRPVTGRDLLVAAVAGFETGPRAGLALYGPDMLTRGWHSGPIFGCPAAAAAASRLFGLGVRETESALGIACTQAGALMSAQYEGMIKRAQHAFAARNGLFGALLARGGYEGMRKVFERPYGGFLAMFSAGNERDPPYKVHEVAAGLGEIWHTELIRIKLHACVGGSHGQIEVLEKLQLKHPDRFTLDQLPRIRKIKVGLSHAIYAHDGWVPESRPLTETGGQMNAAYIGAVQLTDRQVLLEQFSAKKLDDDLVWDLIHKTECYHDSEFDKPNQVAGARITIEFDDGFSLEDWTPWPKGYDPPITNEDIRAKYRKLATSVVDAARMQQIEDLVLNLDKLDETFIVKLGDLLVAPVGNSMA